jgi:alginate O-acetyltransferase complex protein AlgI
MIVMGLGGLWHGAALSYLAWGLLHGLLLVIERPFLFFLDGFSRNRIVGQAVTAFRILFVFACVSLAWVFFKLPNFDHALSFYAGMFTDQPVANPIRIYRSIALIYALPVILQHLMPRDNFAEFRQRLEPYLYGAMAVLTIVEAGPDTTFIYFQF